jgi:pimeloyl-ACP methyl ester carboxylesterase
LRRFTPAGLGVVALLMAVVAPSSALAAPPDPLAEFHRQQVSWGTCTAALSDLECATLVTPLDYAKPEGDRISLVISRRKASDPARRRGVLLVNPGGPGGSGLSMPKFLAGTELAKVYDLIGFDPRGVGGSTALNCRTTPALASIDSRPPDADFATWSAEARAAEDACQRSAGGIRPFVNTPNTARDMDVVRAVLGEAKINYLGYSYGTYLGAVYGTLFGQRLDRSVLDSSVHPEWIWREQFKQQAVAYRRDVDAWAAWVGERNDTFALGADATEVLATTGEIAATLEKTPVDDYTRSVFDGTLGVGARYRPLWSDLAQIVGKLKSGDAPAARSVVKAGRLLAESGLSELRSGVFDTVTCEADWPSDVETYYEDMRVFRDRYPYGFGVLRAAPMTCTFRSFTPPEPVVSLSRNGYPVGVVVQAEGDTQTRYEGGPAMAARLADHLITVTDEGRHGIYGGGNVCVEGKVDRYLVDGVLPASSSDCPGDPRPDVPADPAPAAALKPASGDSLEQSVQSYLGDRGLSSRGF